MGRAVPGFASEFGEGEAELFGFKPSFTWGRDFALDFDDVVPLYYTNVLLVEDDSTTSSYLKSTIKKIVKTPMRVRSFASGEKAGEYVHSLKENHLPGPDIAIIDYRLTGSADGLWLCKLLENRFPETQTILISSTPLDDLKTKMEAYHIKPVFIQKPVKAVNLISLLN